MNLFAHAAWAFAKPRNPPKATDADSRSRFPAEIASISDTRNGPAPPVSAHGLKGNWLRKPSRDGTPIALVEKHAARLLNYLIERGAGGLQIPFHVLQDEYAQVCRHYGWPPLPWNRVAREFRRITTGRVHNRRLKAADGTEYRLRVYPILGDGRERRAA